MTIPKPPVFRGPLVVIFDLEFGGLRPGKHAVLSSSWRSTDGTVNLSALHQPAPGKEVCVASLEKNKLDLNKCMAGLVFADFFWAILAPLFSFYPAVHLVGHNCFSSDAMFIADAIRDAPRAALYSLSHVRFCDTMMPVTTVTGTSGKLQDAFWHLCSKTHPPITEWHTAEADTQALLAVYSQLVTRGYTIPDRSFMSFFRHGVGCDRS